MIVKNININEPCKIKDRENGISIQCNYTNAEYLVDKLTANKDANVLYICSNDCPCPSFHQGFNLSETIKIRNYLNKIIAVSKSAISNVELRH